MTTTATDAASGLACSSHGFGSIPAESSARSRWSSSTRWGYRREQKLPQAQSTSGGSLMVTDASMWTRFVGVFLSSDFDYRSSSLLIVSSSSRV
jgi:hypothetical protein